MKRNEVLQIRIDPHLRERLGRLRQQRHVNISAWLRQLIAEALDRELPADAAEPVAPLAGWRPARLPDGSWGSVCNDDSGLPAQLVGTVIKVRPRSGPPWTSTVTEVVERSPDRILVRDSGRPAAGKTPPGTA